MYDASPWRSRAASVSSYAVPGATHTPGAAVPNPSRVSWDRSSWRLPRSASGTEKTTTSQPSSTDARGRDQIRASPSRSTASAVGESA